MRGSKGINNTTLWINNLHSNTSITSHNIPSYVE
jgi:hypothetical protein